MLRERTHETMLHDGDRQLVRRALRGDPTGWNELYRCCNQAARAAVTATLRRHLGHAPTESVHDLTAEVWVALLDDDRRRLRAFDPDRGRNLSSWVRLIATRLTIDYLRRRGSSPEAVASDAIGRLELVEDDTPERRLSRAQALQRLRRALEQLDPRDQGVVQQLLLDDDARRGARTLGLTASAYYSRRCRLRQRLRQALA